MSISEEFLTCEVHSERVLPVISYFIRCRKSGEDRSLADIFQRVKRGVGVDDRPIPDESEPLMPELIKLIDNGPGKIEGSPTVRHCSIVLSDFG